LLDVEDFTKASLRQRHTEWQRPCSGTPVWPGEPVNGVVANAILQCGELLKPSARAQTAFVREEPPHTVSLSQPLHRG
jgi:hypothetical protein